MSAGRSVSSSFSDLYWYSEVREVDQQRQSLLRMRTTSSKSSRCLSGNNRTKLGDPVYGPRPSLSQALETLQQASFASMRGISLGSSKTDDDMSLKDAIVALSQDSYSFVSVDTITYEAENITTNATHETTGNTIVSITDMTSFQQHKDDGHDETTCLVGLLIRRSRSQELSKGRRSRRKIRTGSRLAMDARVERVGQFFASAAANCGQISPN